MLVDAVSTGCLKEGHGGGGSVILSGSLFDGERVFLKQRNQRSSFSDVIERPKTFKRVIFGKICESCSFEVCTEHQHCTYSRKEIAFCGFIVVFDIFEGLDEVSYGS